MKAVLALLVSSAASLAAAEAPRCTAVPGDLFQPVTGVFPKGMPEGARLAGSGRLLGVLIPQLPEGHTLILLRGEKVVEEYWLAAPKDSPFPRPPAFYLGGKGDVAVLRSQAFFAVYLSGTLASMVRGENIRGADVVATSDELLWTPTPTDQTNAKFLRQNDLGKLKEEDWPALLVRSEMDGSDQEVLLRLDEPALKKSGPLPLYAELSPAVRSDGKLWLVGAFSGEIMLADPNGRVVRRLTLASAVKRPEDDPEVRKQRDEQNRRDAEEWAAKSAPSDAMKRPPKSTKLLWFDKTRVVNRVYARGRDLVVLTMETLDPPPGSLLVLRDGDEAVTCFQFPHRLRGVGEGAPLQISFTDDAVWFRDPFGYIPWERLDELLEPKKPEAKSR